jgi:outer membrane biosynthesis protein TonB
MTRTVLRFSAAVLALSLAACGGADQPDNNIAAEDLNATTKLEDMAPVTPTANVAVEETVKETQESEPATAKPAPAKTATATPKPTPTESKPEPVAEPKAPDASCSPEHRAAGHC